MTMAAKRNVTVSNDLPAHRSTASERRAALTAAIAGQQQNLKREAAERRVRRAADVARAGDAQPTSAPAG